MPGGRVLSSSAVVKPAKDLRAKLLRWAGTCRVWPGGRWARSWGGSRWAEVVTGWGARRTPLAASIRLSGWPSHCGNTAGQGQNLVEVGETQIGVVPQLIGENAVPLGPGFVDETIDQRFATGKRNRQMDGRIFTSELDSIVQDLAGSGK